MAIAVLLPRAFLPQWAEPAFQKQVRSACRRRRYHRPAGFSTLTVWAALDPSRRASQRQKDLAGIARILDDSGELVPSRTIRNGEPDPEWRRFSCRVEVWRALQAVAGDHGWVPAGTSLDPTAERRNQLRTEQIDRGILSADTAAGYRSRLERAKLDVGCEPQTWAYAKVVSGADAAAVADALERALAAGACRADDRRIDGPTFIREGMTREEYTAFNRG